MNSTHQRCTAIPTGIWKINPLIHWVFTFSDCTVMNRNSDGFEFCEQTEEVILDMYTCYNQEEIPSAKLCDENEDCRDGM